MFYLILTSLAPALAYLVFRIATKPEASGAVTAANAYLIVSIGAVLSIVGAIGATIAVVESPVLSLTLANFVQGSSGSIVSIGVYLDRVGAVMLGLVSIISFVVIRFSKRYLDGEPRQIYFLKWLAITIAAIQVLVISSNLSMFLVAWLAVSLSLHRLLAYYSDRPAAIECAHQKFLISRVGDVCLVIAAALIAKNFGTLEFLALTQIARDTTDADSVGSLKLISVLFALGALIKSAQLPFQSWLPQSLETPTPVSALMHAGIINAGGFLIIRVSPLLTHAPAASTLLAVVGGVTALYGMSVMVTQTSIKKRLAYSTIGQMGFMIMQCGLGLYALALLHIVAHGFYKACAFLQAGGAMDQAREQIFFPERRTNSLVLFAASLVVAGLVGAHCIYELQNSSMLEINPNYIPIKAVWFLAVFNLVLGASSVRGQTILSTGLGIGFAILLALFYFTLSTAARHFLPQMDHFQAALPSSVILFLVGLAIIGFLFQVFGKVLTRSELGAALHIHIHSGLYLEAICNRISSSISKKLSMN